MKNQNTVFHMFKGLYVASRDALAFDFVADEGLQSSVDRLDLGSRMGSGKYDPLIATLNGGFTWYCFSV